MTATQRATAQKLLRRAERAAAVSARLLDQAERFLAAHNEPDLAGLASRAANAAAAAAVGAATLRGKVERSRQLDLFG